MRSAGGDGPGGRRGFRPARAERARDPDESSTATGGVDANAALLYFDVMKQCLTYSIWGEPMLRDPHFDPAVRLDGDMYESTIEALTHLYPKLSVGGYVIIDDYGYAESCRRAVNDFRHNGGIDDAMRAIDRDGVYWQRSR